MRPLPTTVLALVLLILGADRVVTGEDKPAREGALQIPLGKAATVDGKVEDAEWSDALGVKVGEEGAVRLKHDRESLYLSWSRFPGQGYACLFVKSGDDVKVFHASQALGSALYEKKGDVWNPKVKAYAWKKPDVLWKEEGWKASTQASGGQEFAVSFKTLGIEGNTPASIALGYVFFEKGVGKSVIWPDAKDSCGDDKLLCGFNPEGLKFDFAKWAAIQPAATPPADRKGGGLGRKKSLALYFEGHKLADQGRYAEAVLKYLPWNEYQESVGEDSSEVKGLIGRMYDLAGNPSEAEAWLNKSLSLKLDPRICVDKARFLARNRDLKSAEAFLDEVAVVPALRTWMKGRFYLTSGLYKEALPHLKAVFEASQGSESRFDEKDHLKSNPSPGDAASHNAIAGMLDPLEDLCACEFGADDDDAAWRTSERAISVGQALDVDKTYLSEDYRQCGSVACRIIRARILLKKNEVEGAKHELALASVVAARNYTGHEAELRALNAEVGRRGGGKDAPLPK